MTRLKNMQKNENRTDQTWQEISENLRQVLRSAAGIAKERGLITEEREHTYHISGNFVYQF